MADRPSPHSPQRDSDGAGDGSGREGRRDRSEHHTRKLSQHDSERQQQQQQQYDVSAPPMAGGRVQSVQGVQGPPHDLHETYGPAFLADQARRAWARARGWTPPPLDLDAEEWTAWVQREEENSLARLWADRARQRARARARAEARETLLRETLREARRLEMIAAAETRPLVLRLPGPETTTTTAPTVAAEEDTMGMAGRGEQPSSSRPGGGPPRPFDPAKEERVTWSRAALDGEKSGPGRPGTWTDHAVAVGKVIAARRFSTGWLYRVLWFVGTDEHGHPLWQERERWIWQEYLAAINDPLPYPELRRTPRPTRPRQRHPHQQQQQQTDNTPTPPRSMPSRP